MTTTLRRALAAAIVVPALLTVGACKAEVSAGGYDPDDLADQVQAAQEKATPDLEVTDPRCDDVDGNPAKGDTIDCTVTIAGVEAPYVVTVTSGDDDGAQFHLDPAKAIVSLDKAASVMADELAKQGFDGVAVDCGDQAILVEDPGATFTCTATQGKRTQDLTATIKDLDGNVDFSS